MKTQIPKKNGVIDSGLFGLPTRKPTWQIEDQPCLKDRISYSKSFFFQCQVYFVWGQKWQILRIPTLCPVQKSPVVFHHDPSWGDQDRNHPRPRAIFSAAEKSLGSQLGIWVGEAEKGRFPNKWDISCIHIQINSGWCQLKYFWNFHPYLGNWSNLTSIFFKWVETTN